MSVLSTGQIMANAWKAGVVIPAWNIPYLPMMEPVMRAMRDTSTFGLIQVARLEWVKFHAGSPRAVRDEYERLRDDRFTRLHLDHVPVIDEDGRRVDAEEVLAEAIKLGYGSVMIDGSRLGLEENIAATARAARLAHAAGVPIEAELGAVLGHESGPLPPYEELLASGKGFTDPQEAARFVAETGADWLSVAIGNIHGAISAAARGRKKLQARLDLDQLDRIRQAAGVPLVLHGGSGIRKDCLLEAFRRGVAKINIGTSIRQAYEAQVGKPVEQARQAVYDEAVRLVKDELEVAGKAAIVNPGK
jgi:ketose-bisphosphate aldolase